MRLHLLSNREDDFVISSIYNIMLFFRVNVNDINIAFWNLGNLFDISSSEPALVHEFTPDRGWTKEVLDKKLENLAQVS